MHSQQRLADCCCHYLDGKSKATCITHQNLCVYQHFLDRTESTVVGLSLLFAGCSRVQFAYNQLDWLIPYYVDTQIELTDSQEDYLQQRVDALLDWHCSTHLEAYADLLRSANTDFQNGTMSEQKLRHFFSRVELYWKEIKRQANPAIAHLLLTASDSQVEELFNNLTNKDIE